MASGKAKRLTAEQTCPRSVSGTDHVSSTGTTNPALSWLSGSRGVDRLRAREATANKHVMNTSASRTRGSGYKACLPSKTAVVLRGRLVGQTLEWPNLHSVRLSDVAFRLYLVIIVQSLTN